MTQPVLLLIDLQKGFDEIAARTPRNNLNAEAHAMRLIEFWRQHKWPVIHVRHDSTEPDSPFRPERFGNRVMDFAIEHVGEPVLRKTVNSGFIGTDLAARLDALGRPPVVVAGATTDHCVSTTVRMGANLGYPMTLVADACFTFGRTAPDGTTLSAEEMHRAHLASLEGEFARVVTAGALLAELAASPG
jgi:nicotinamidase-related amidase